MSEFPLEFYNAISQALFVEGAGEHLPAQVRADYRRVVARHIHAVLIEAGWDLTPPVSPTPRASAETEESSE